MSIEIWSILAEWTGAALIIVSLVYLARQVRGETLARKAQTHQELAVSRRNGLELHLNNQELRAARFKSQNGETLNEAEQDILFWYFALMLRDFENLVYQYSLGTLDQEELDLSRELLRIQFESEPGFRIAAKKIIARFLSTYSVTMRAEMDKLGLI